MNMYLVPITEPYGYNYTHFEFVIAKSSEEAYEKLNKKYKNRSIFNQYEFYEEYSYSDLYADRLSQLLGKPFHILDKNDILTTYYRLTENYIMTFFNINWKDYTDTLSSIAMTETWSNDTYPNNGILTNYMVHTVKKLKSEKKIITTKEYGLFNTGLFTNFYEPIFVYATSENPIFFMTPYELGSIGIDDYPERADYFQDPSLLLFDWHYKINVHYKHILEDINNIKRIPKEVQENKNILNNLNGSIETMKKRVSANYKLAIPQYFDNKIQLLLPLCLQTDDVPDLALVVTKVGNVYQGHTCLTLDMAYNNARLIAKPESNWLSTNNVLK